MIYVLIVLIVLLILFIVYSPKHVKIKLSNSNPPILAWINSPSENATVNQRQVKLPYGVVYSIPERSSAHFVLVFDWEIETDIDYLKVYLIIPSKFATDFASIPKLLHWLISPLTNTVYAAIIHDYLYRNPEDLNAKAISKAQTDCAFYCGMRLIGVKRVTACLMYWAERLFGGSSFIRS